MSRKCYLSLSCCDLCCFQAPEKKTAPAAPAKQANTASANTANANANTANANTANANANAKSAGTANGPNKLMQNFGKPPTSMDEFEIQGKRKEKKLSAVVMLFFDCRIAGKGTFWKGVSVSKEGHRPHIRHQSEENEMEISLVFFDLAVFRLC